MFHFRVLLISSFKYDFLWHRMRAKRDLATDKLARSWWLRGRRGTRPRSTIRRRDRNRGPRRRTSVISRKFAALPAESASREESISSHAREEKKKRAAGDERLYPSFSFLFSLFLLRRSQLEMRSCCEAGGQIAVYTLSPIDATNPILPPVRGLIRGLIRVSAFHAPIK